VFGDEKLSVSDKHKGAGNVSSAGKTYEELEADFTKKEEELREAMKAEDWERVLGVEREMIQLAEALKAHPDNPFRKQ
jgi:hypothetical protein